MYFSANQHSQKQHNIYNVYSVSSGNSQTLGSREIWARWNDTDVVCFSPSHTEHRFNRCEIKDGYPFHYAKDLDIVPSMINFHQTNVAEPFSRHFHRGCPPPLYIGHVTRVQGTPLRLEPRGTERGRFISQFKSLPVVPIVKGLIMRRQFRREIHVGTLSRLLSRSFVALEWFRFERTISPEPHKQISFDQGMKRGTVFTEGI